MTLRLAGGAGGVAASLAFALALALAVAGSAPARGESSPSGVIEGEVSKRFEGVATAGSQEVVVTGLRIDLRYRFASLLGELLWLFEARYDFEGPLASSLRIGGTSSVTAVDGAGVVRVAENASGGVDLEVSADLLRRVRVVDLDFILWCDPEAELGLEAGRFFVHRPYPGVFGRAGAWGWDVPASPAWERSFNASVLNARDGRHRRREPFRPDHFFSAAQSKAIFQQMLRLRERRGDGFPIFSRVFSTFYNVKLELSDFVREVERLQPGATRHLLRPRSADDGAAAARPRDVLVNKLIDAVDRELATSADGRAAATSGAVRGAVLAVDRALERFGDDVSPRVRAAWAERRRAALGARAERELELVWRAAEPILRATRPDEQPAWPADLQARVAEVQRALESLAQDLGDDDPLVERGRRLVALLAPRGPAPPRLKGKEQGFDIYVHTAPGGLEIEMVHVPPGPFVMGSDRPEDAMVRTDQRPQHTHRMERGYFIGRYETTVREYVAYLRATGTADADRRYNATHLSHPVQVNWAEAKAFCDWAGLALPSEAQWEKAARGPDGRTFPWGGTTPARGTPRFANVLDEAYRREDWGFEASFGPRAGAFLGYDDGFAGTAPVGSFPAGASPYGAHDMIGNAQEWTGDSYESGAYARYARGDLTPPAPGAERVARGGDCQSASWKTTTTFRAPMHPDLSAGFRPVWVSP
ncbi:MAG: formylglycine-generating enzyme family protein [Planctomycetes bacterium]|nr:formylglycine-generating enzyme family protein [Planctomycetota bacterium]